MKALVIVFVLVAASAFGKTVECRYPSSCDEVVSVDYDRDQRSVSLSCFEVDGDLVAVTAGTTAGHGDRIELSPGGSSSLSCD